MVGQSDWLPMTIATGADEFWAFMEMSFSSVEAEIAILALSFGLDNPKAIHQPNPSDLDASAPISL